MRWSASSASTRPRRASRSSNAGSLSPLASATRSRSSPTTRAAARSLRSMPSPPATTPRRARRPAAATGAAPSTVTATIGQFNEIRVEVVYPTGGGFTDQEVFLRSITVNGTVLSRLAPAKVTRRDDTSISRYKLKTLTLRDTWIDNAANMTARADALLAVLKSPETRLEFDWFVEDYALFRALELSDRIQLRLPGYTEQAFIEHVALNIPNDGVVPICTVQATVTAAVSVPPPTPAEDSVTVPLTGVSEFTNYIRWSDNQSLGSLFDANDAEQVLTYADLNNAGPAGQVGLSIVGTNNRFTPAFEACGAHHL